MEMRMVDMKDIVANPLQPREHFDREKLKELADSIKQADLLQPITVRKKGKKFEIVCGERRFKAFQILNANKIPAIIRDIKDDTEALEKSAIENWHRDDLTDIEKRNVINELWKSGRYKSLKELSRKTGIRDTNIGDYLEEQEYRNRDCDIPEEASHTAIRATRGLSDKVRGKVVRVAVAEDIPARELEESIVPKLKKFKREDEQLEEIDRIVKRKKDAREYEEDGFERDVGIAEGEIHPEVKLKEEYSFFMEDLEKTCRSIKNYGVANLSHLPKAKKDKALNLWIETIAYMLNELKKTDETVYNKLRREVE